MQMAYRTRHERVTLMVGFDYEPMRNATSSWFPTDPKASLTTTATTFTIRDRFVGVALE